MFKILQQGSEDVFGKRIDDLNFDEASRLLGGAIMASTSSTAGRVSREGKVIVDAIEDGQEALAGYGRQVAREIAPRIDDERELIINIVRNKTLWDTIRGRDPKVDQTLRYRNDPPQYA